jgi:signal transduction histidine kinase
MRVDVAGVSHVITIGEDITEWKEAEARFARPRMLAAIGQLAAGVMHEINNPLATIAACAESLAMRVDEMRASGAEIPSDGPEYLKIIDNEVHRCKRIIDGPARLQPPENRHEDGARHQLRHRGDPLSPQAPLALQEDHVRTDFDARCAIRC